MYSNAPRSNCSFDVIVRQIPRWLELENRYANEKHGDENPQLQSLTGALLDPVSGAFQDHHNYYSRFKYFYKAADGDERINLRANQQLGKALNTSRALLRVVIEKAENTSRLVADSRTYEIGRLVASTLSTQREITAPRVDDFLPSVVEPAISVVGEQLAYEDYDSARKTSTELFESHFQLFADFSCSIGFMATPGISSTDEYNQLTQWSLT